jgi:hypothetical protein
MICRIWHGWTTPANADAYETLLRSEIFQGIQSRQIEGFKGIHLLWRSLGDEVESITGENRKPFRLGAFGRPSDRVRSLAPRRVIP